MNDNILKNISVKTNAIVAMFVGICVFLLTLLIAPYYVLGDQQYYIAAYNGISDLSFTEGFVFYSSTLGSAELIHYLITWLASGGGVEKNSLMAFSNAFLAYSSMRLFEKWGASIFVAMAIVLTNFYLFELYFAAERLKFGFVFLVLSMSHLGQPKRFYPLTALAIFSHVQVSLIYASMLFRKLVTQSIIFLKTFRFRLSYIILIIPIIMLALLAFLGEHIYLKFQHYSVLAGKKDIFDLTRIALLLIMSLWYSRNKNEVILLFIPIILAVFVLGSDRVNMMGYFIFLYYGLQYKGGLNLGVLATTVYFALKSYAFVSDIFAYGDGFQNIGS